MTIPHIQNSFVAGELAPSFFGRTDKAEYRNGASTARNFFINYRGGASSRAGYAYVGMCKQGAPNDGGTPTDDPPRDINFQYNINVGYALEFGDQYMRVKYQGAYVTETAQNITDISNSSPGVVTISAHGFEDGDWVHITGVGGMTSLNGLTYIVQDSNTNDFTLTDLFGDAIDTTLLPAYTSGGTAARIYTAVAPYAAIDLPYLKFTQSANTMNLACVNQETGTEYIQYNLQRLAQTNWTFTPVAIDSAIGPPATVTSVATSSTTQNTWYSYVVTAEDANGNESIASAATDVLNNNISINAGSNTISYSSVPGAVRYNVYAATPIFTTTPFNNPGFVGTQYGYMGFSFGAKFVDTNIIPDFTKTPPLYNNPFARGQILNVQVTAGGSSYTQAGIGYTINSTTGTDFAGTPLVSTGGVFVGFDIRNAGQNYVVGDLIFITNGSNYARGSYTFIDNPTNGQTILLNGASPAWSFRASPPAGPLYNTTLIGATLADTLAQLAFDLNTSGNTLVNQASFAISGSVMNITYRTAGTAGNSYTLGAGTYGGIVSGATLTGGANGGAGGSGATASLIIGPQTGTYPGAVQYFQQRLTYANSLNEPDTYNMSQPGRYINFDSSIPVIDSDAISGTPWGMQINGIQFMIPTISGLLTFTGNGVWLINGGSSKAITPSNQNADAQAQIGCSAIVPPLYINQHILYVQAKNSLVRDIAFNFLYNVFQGSDITLYSNHLFTNHTITQWAYAEEPYKVAWVIRNDGTMLSLTYIKEQQVQGWARSDTNGFFVGVCAVTEPPVDAVYVITKRYIVGHDVWVYYSERANNRIWRNVEDCFCVDAGLTYPQTYPDATLMPAALDGTDNISTTNIINGGTGYTAPTLAAVDSDGLGSGATFSATVAGGVITVVTVLTEGSNYTPGATTIIITDSTGVGAVIQPIITNNVVFTADSAVFDSGTVGDVIRVDGGKATITTYTSPTEVIANITQPLTTVVPDDPEELPAPAISGTWTISTPTTTVSGLNHLEGMEVSILADGGVQPVQTVTDGAITLQNEASAITVGLGFNAQLQSLYLDPPSQVTTQGKRKDIQAVTVRLEQSRGIRVGTNQPDQSTQPNFATLPWTNMKAPKERNALITAGSEIPLFTGDERVIVPGDWNEKGQVAIDQINPLPVNVLAIVPEYTMGDNNG